MRGTMRRNSKRKNISLSILQSTKNTKNDDNEITEPWYIKNQKNQENQKNSTANTDIPPQSLEPLPISRSEFRRPIILFIIFMIISFFLIWYLYVHAGSFNKLAYGALSHNDDHYNNNLIEASNDDYRIGVSPLVDNEVNTVNNEYILLEGADLLDIHNNTSIVNNRENNGRLNLERNHRTGTIHIFNMTYSDSNYNENSEFINHSDINSEFITYGNVDSSTCSHSTGYNDNYSNNNHNNETEYWTSSDKKESDRKCDKNEESKRKNKTNEENKRNNKTNEESNLIPNNMWLHFYL